MQKNSELCKRSELRETPYSYRSQERDTWKMWPSRKLHLSSYFTISPSAMIFLLLPPLLIISLIACNLGPTFYSWKSIKLLTAYSLRSLINGEGHHDFSRPNSVVSIGSFHYKSKNLRIQGLMKHSSSNAEMRGFVSSGVHATPTRSEKVEAILANARYAIREAAGVKKSFISSQQDGTKNPGFVPRGSAYQNSNAFHRSYMEMEKTFKIYVYEEGDMPIFHNGPCRSIYSTEGRFIHEMEKGNQYRTRDPEKAHVFFMPFSVVVMVQYLYEPGSIDRNPIGRTLTDYIDTISQRHKFWNRSLGADHFMLSCHDWGPYTTSYVPLMFNNSIRVLCNANTSEGFNPLKDASLPEINLKTGEIAGLLGGSPPSERTLLAFFAGGLHGHIRHLLLRQWKGKDPDIHVYERVPKNVSYEKMLKMSKYCLCPSGYEVASPRIVEAIYAECVPVLISDSYVPPFSDVLDWRKFSVLVAVEDIPNIKRILMGISEEKYVKLQRNVKQVQRHFVINGSPKRYDLFHMILHSVWLRRLNRRLHESV